MKKIVVASKNPVKISAVEAGFRKMFPEDQFDIIGVPAQSNVADQPMTDSETFQGALNRADNAFIHTPEAEYWVGIEGGVEEKNGELEAFAWVVIRSHKKTYGKGRTSTFFLPTQVAELVKDGKELGHASDAVFQEDNSKQKQGTIGILTNNVIDRKTYYIDPVVIALIPFKNPTLYLK